MKKTLSDIAYSILDLAPVTEEGSPAEAFRNSLELARHAEKLGYTRYWLAEHHNMPGIASSATAVVIGYIAGGTSTIRVGSGGVMLPNHAPLIVAEQFGTLESMYPGRIDLGLGRAPGTDYPTTRALRKESTGGGDQFPYMLEELRAYLEPPTEKPRAVRAVPGEGMDIPIWLLGSSGFSAQLAGQLGLPFGFASHFSPEYTLPALELYRSHFQPSDVLDKPYAMVGVNVITAEDDETAQWLATSQQQQFLNLVRGRPGKLQPPVKELDWTAEEKLHLAGQLKHSIAGSPDTVRERLQAFLDDTQADEMIINTHVYDHQARLRSIEWTSQLFKK